MPPDFTPPPPDRPPSLHSSARPQPMTVDPDEAQVAQYEADRRIADFANQL